MHAGAKTFVLCFLVCFLIFGKKFGFFVFLCVFFCICILHRDFRDFVAPPHTRKPRKPTTRQAVRGTPRFPSPAGVCQTDLPTNVQGFCFEWSCVGVTRKRRRSVTEPLVFYYKGQMLEGGAVLCCPSKGNVELASWKNIAQPQPANGHF